MKNVPHRLGRSRERAIILIVFNDQAYLQFKQTKARNLKFKNSRVINLR
jgi:hypothetical protein